MADALVLGASTERCRGSSPLSCIFRFIASLSLTVRRVGPRILIVLALLGCGSARADTIWVRSHGTDVAFPNLRVDGVEDGQLSYEDASGRHSIWDLAQVSRLALDDEPALAPAEEAFAQKKWAEAAQGYQLALDATQKPWLKIWIAQRLLDAGTNSGDVPSQVQGYLTLVHLAPKRAADFVLLLPENNPVVLAQASQNVSAALEEPGLSHEQRQCLLNLLLDIAQARHDKSAVDQIFDRLRAAVTSPRRRRLCGEDSTASPNCFNTSSGRGPGS